MASVVRVIPQDIYERLVSSGSLEIELLKTKLDTKSEKVKESQIVQSGEGLDKKECNNLIRFEERFILQ